MSVGSGQSGVGSEEVRKGGCVSVGSREGVVVGSCRRGQGGGAQGWVSVWGLGSLRCRGQG